MSFGAERLLFEQLRSGFQHSIRGGVCQFIFDGLQARDFHICVSADALEFREGRHASPSTSIAMSSGVLLGILARRDAVDFRDPSVRGRIEVSGDLELANLLSKLVKQPPAFAAARLREAARVAGRRSRPREIVRAHRPLRDDVVALLRESVPCVATGLLDEIPARGWSLADLRDRYGSIPLCTRLDGRLETVAEFVDRLSMGGPETASTRGCPLPAALRNAFPFPFFEDEDLTPAQLWLGRRPGTTPITSLHRDCYDGFLAHFLGEKRMALYSPDQEDCLYPYRSFNHGQYCWVDPSAPDLESYPRFAEAEALEIVLRPGDLLINPAGWFHCVWATSTVWSVSRFLRNEAWERLSIP